MTSPNGQAPAHRSPTIRSSVPLLQLDAGVVCKTVRLFIGKIGALLPCPLHSYLRVHSSDRKNNCLWRDTLRVYRNALALILIVGHRGTGDRHLDSGAIREGACPNAVLRVRGGFRGADCKCRRCSQQKSERVSAV
jgi:hypothetical protein